MVEELKTAFPLHARLITSVVRSGPIVVQLAIALDLFGLSAILFIHPNFSYSRAFTWMSRHGTEIEWSRIIFFFGCVALSGILVPNRMVKFLAAFISGSFTSMLSWSYYTSNPVGAGWLPYTILTMLAYWLMIYRAFSDERH